jgi:hypothetical protein
VSPQARRPVGRHSKTPVEQASDDPPRAPDRHRVALPLEKLEVRAQGSLAEIVMEPTNMSYGARNYCVRDLEGHLWSYGTYRPRVRQP